MIVCIEDVADRNRLELSIAEGRIGLLQYQRTRELLVIEHTEVAPSHEGNGYAGQLVKLALDQAARERRRVIVVCPYAKAWLRRHPEYSDLDYTRDRVPPRQDPGWVVHQTTAQAGQAFGR